MHQILVEGSNIEIETNPDGTTFSKVRLTPVQTGELGGYLEAVNYKVRDTITVTIDSEGDKPQ